MSAIINVDKKKRDDPHYRYKMPSIECKVESGGNGVKVVFSNLPDVAYAIHRPAEALLKFLGVSRGAQSTFDAKDNKYYIMGNHLPNEIQDCVFEFIERFVLCKSCRNPETEVIPGRSVKMNCVACGKDTSLDAQDDKIVRELLKKTGPRTETVKDRDDKIGSPAVLEGEITTVLDLTLEHALPGETSTSKDPSAALFEALREVKTIGRIGVQKKLIAIKSEHGVSDDDMPRLIFRGACDRAIDGNLPFIAALRDAAFLFKNQMDGCRSASDKVSSLQDTILSEVCLRIINKEKSEKVPMVLKMFIDESVLEPSKVIAFCKGLETNAQIRKKAQLPMLAEQVKVLVQWLEEGTTKDVVVEAGEVETVEEDAAKAKAKKSKKVIEA